MKFKAIWILLLVCLQAKAQMFPYRYFAPITTSPSEEIRCMYFDKEGKMWIGTNAGVKSYDGYNIRTYKSDAYTPGILPNNTLRSITEDNNDCLWLGTNNGLVRMNKRTGEFKTFYLPKESQRTIYTLFTAKDGTIWIGTDGGLSYFNPKTESFYTYDSSNTWVVESNGKRVRIFNYSVKSILEDSQGNILIGTWVAGLFRFRPGTHTFYRYPQFNKMNSAYSLYLDKHGRLWVGTWGYGVVRIDNPKNYQHPQIHQYPYKTNNFDIFQKIIEDPVTKTLWACTREGVSILDLRNPNAQWTNYRQIGANSLNFCSDIATDRLGNVWMSTQNFGVIQANTSPSPFHLWSPDLLKVNPMTNYIRSIYTEDGKTFWLGLNPYGIVKYNRETGSCLYNKEIQGFESIPSDVLTTSISSIIKRSNGEMWFATNSYGLLIKSRDNHTIQLNTKNTPYITDDFANVAFEDKNKNVWIGMRDGLSVVFTDNKGKKLTMKEGAVDFSKCDIRNIIQDKQGCLWIATDNEGIIQVKGNPKNPKSMKFHQYSPAHNNYANKDALACLEDRYGRLWAISNSSGLFLYNKEKDCFEPKGREYHIPGDRVMSINEDQYGNLWFTTDNSLVHLTWNPKDLSKPEEITTFTKEDGLGAILFAENATCKFGKELFFCNKNSIFSFVPTINFGSKKKEEAHLVITDLLIDDVPYTALDSTLRKDVSEKMPAYTRLITIPASIKKFGIEFSLLTYGNALKNMYAYRLEGYDDNWHYCEESGHRADFQNLPSGTYEFHLKATDSYGHWQELPYTLTIRVLPPWYASRLAYMLYLLILIGSIFGVARWYKVHLKTKNRLQMGVILTNITHELLTPLTVISATIYKLKSMAPQYEEDYLVMDSNINRTTRLLRQILEVRKSQAGQLKLLVSRGNLSAFVQNACENIRPMAQHEGLSLTTKIPEGECMAWFDADKLDKILYNLLSNAIKYNKKEGSIWVSLMVDKNDATITIADNGIGMSKEKLKHLYSRFFDGDYRKQNQPGTGIGLSLTHDLVQLHHGSIHCKSNEGKGTTFIVTIPIHKSAFNEKEIDKSRVSKQVDNLSIQIAQETTTTSEIKKSNTLHHSVFIRKNVNKILVVEDNEELLELMLQMLSKRYHVLTARNGKQAMNIIMKEKLDLVVSDVMMPVMDGMELTQRIKSDKSFWQLPVILLTAKNKDEEKNEGYSVGADDYITKPFNFDELVVRIDTLIANRQKVKESIVQDVPTAETVNKPKPTHFSDPDKAFVKRATEMVMQHLDDADYDRDTFAKDMAVGGSTLYNKVKATTGQTVVAFITGIRLREAHRIMEEEPNILISDLATRVGFNTPKYFSKCFKKEYGMFPKEFAEEVKKSPYS